jgi:hypothetical protein
LFLSHIIYGSRTIKQGDILLTARSGGNRALLATYEFSLGATEEITVTVLGHGEGSVVAQAPAVGPPTEREWLAALRAAPGFTTLFYSSLEGEGLDPVAAPDAPLGPAGGLLQHLVASVQIGRWDNRDQVTAGVAEALLWPAGGEVVRQSPESDGFDLMQGTLELNVALQLNDGFHLQNELLDLVRRRVFQAVKRFDHPCLNSMGPAKWTYSNVQKPTAASVQREEEPAPLEQGDLNVLFSLPISWSEPAWDDDLMSFSEFQSLQVGLFREPLTDPLGPGGGEVLDELITITPEEE